MKLSLSRLRSVLPKSEIEVIPSDTDQSMIGSGVRHRGNSYITHTDLHHEHSAIRTFYPWQLFLILATIVALIISFLHNPISTGIIFVAVITTIYFLDVLFNMFLVVKSLHIPPELVFSSEDLQAIDRKKLPIYTILCPLYRESEVLPDFTAAVNNLDWPKEKLEVLLLLEEDDTRTIETAKSLNLPAFFKIIVVPHSLPKTKPKACNFGLSHSHGQYLVIYDAEDRPDPDQLKKAYLGFQSSPEHIACLQAKLNYFNPNFNLLTRFFTAEYSLWFDVVLPGLQSIETTIPLGGTSNHFRTSILRQLKGWDAFNVTEDADLGTRLFKLGYRTAIIDSTTLEEANSRWGSWLKQRSRWIKGYIQTFLVHNRHPLKFIRSHGMHAFIFQVLMGGKIAFMLINPILWLITISYFLLYKYVGPTIESLYPPVIFYMAAFSLVVGNFLFLYYYMIGCAKRAHWHLVKFVYLIPFYWLMISLAAVKAVIQLVFKPYYWEKTTHGLHLQVKKDEVATEITSGSRSAVFVPQFIYNLVGKSWSGGLALILVSVIANFLNFLYNAYLGRQISLEQFGLVSLFGGVLYVAQVIFSAFSRAVTRTVALAFGRRGVPAKKIWSTFRIWAFYASLIFSLVWIALAPSLRFLFKSGEIGPFLIFSPIWIVGLLSAVDSGFLSGSQRFGVLALATFAEAIIKFLTAVIFVRLNLSPLVYLSIPFSMFASFVLSWVYILLFTKKQNVEDLEAIRFPIKFTFISILNRLSTITFIGLDVILAKLLLSPKDAGQFALLSLIGKIVYFSGTVSNQFIIPLVSKEEGARRDPSQVFNKILIATVAATSIIFLPLVTFGRIILPAIFGLRFNDVIPYLPFYLLGVSSFTIANTVVVYHQTRNRFFVPIVSFVFSLLLVLIVTLSPQNLATFSYTFGLVGVLQILLTGILHRLTRYSQAISQNTFAFLDLFSRQKTRPVTTTSQIRFLILNWRDTKHVWAGGAEVYVQELARHFVSQGHTVTIFCGNDGRSKRNDSIDGVNIIRRGGFFTVYIWAFLYYIFRFHDQFDVIVDTENGIPFFTPFYSRRPKFLLIFHVHQNYFRENLSFPMRQIASFMEKELMPFAYKGQKIITISNSTKNDLIKLNLAISKDITIINPGIRKFPLVKKYTKTKNPSILYLGRLRPYKNVDIAIRAHKELLKDFPMAKFHIAGTGESYEYLKQLRDRLGLTKSVIFHGNVDEETKAKLYKKSWVMVQPSSIEGWGITVIEANAFGTPVIASNVPGLKDSVKNNITGILVPAKNVYKLADSLKLLISNRNLRNQLSKNSVKYAHNFDWDNNARNFLAAVTKYLKNRYNLRVAPAKNNA